MVQHEFKVPSVVFDHKGSFVEFLLFKEIFSTSFKIIFMVFTKLVIIKAKLFMGSIPPKLNLL